MSGAPKFSEYDYRIDITEKNTIIYVFLRNHFKEFLDFVIQNFEVIIYGTGEPFYIEKLMEIVDPENKIKIRLTQNDCHLYRNTNNKYAELLRDINQFENRSIKKKVLLETSTLGYVLNPDNGKKMFKIIF